MQEINLSLMTKLVDKFHELTGCFLFSFLYFFHLIECSSSLQHTVHVLPALFKNSASRRPELARDPFP